MDMEVDLEEVEVLVEELGQQVTSRQQVGL